MTEIYLIGRETARAWSSSPLGGWWPWSCCSCARDPAAVHPGAGGGVRAHARGRAGREALEGPRWSAVIVVYVLSHRGILLVARRDGAPARRRDAGLFRELPAMAATDPREHVPALRRWLSGLTGVPPPPAVEGPPRRRAPCASCRSTTDRSKSTSARASSFTRLPRGAGRSSRCRTRRGPFEPGKFVSDAVSKSIAYVQRNTMEVIRLGRSIIAAVSRAIFVFFMTLMLAAYMMITRERIIGFLPLAGLSRCAAHRSTCCSRASIAGSPAWCAGSFSFAWSTACSRRSASGSST